MTDPGTIAALLSLPTSRRHPPAGAAVASVPLQETSPPPATSAGEQLIPETFGYAYTVSEAVAELPLNVAVMLAAVVDAVFDVEIGMLCAVAPAGTVTVDGTCTIGELLVSETTAPLSPAGAGRATIATVGDPPSTVVDAPNESAMPPIVSVAR